MAMSLTNTEETTEVTSLASKDTPASLSVKTPSAVLTDVAKRARIRG